MTWFSTFPENLSQLRTCTHTRRRYNRYQYTIIVPHQCSNWKLLSRGAQLNDLKTAFKVQNYLTREGRNM